MNADRVASYQDWRDDLRRGVGPVTGLPYALADLLIDAWINPDTYDIARGSIDMSPWGFPTDRDGTVSAIRERAALLGRVWTAHASKIPQNVPDRKGVHVIPVRWWNMDGYRLVPVSQGCEYAFAYAAVDAFAAAWREAGALPKSREAEDDLARWCGDAREAVARLVTVLGRKSASVHIPPVLDWSAETLRFLAGRGEDGEGISLRTGLEDLAFYLESYGHALSEKTDPSALGRAADASRKRDQVQTYLRAGLALLDEYGYSTDGYAETFVTSVAREASSAEIEPHHVRQAQKALRYSAKRNS